MIAALTEKEHAAKAAFNNAVNDGEDANALYMSWKAVKDELDMLQAKLEALAHSGIGKQVPQLAKQMETEGHKEVDTIQAEKVKLFEELEAIREQYLKVAYKIFQKQRRQSEVKQELDSVRRVVMIHIAKGYLDSSITDVISKHKIRELLQINEEDLKRAEIITKERAFPSSQDIYNKISEMPADERKTAARFELYKGIMKDRQQDGFLISYPFGDVVKQPNLSFFYRGENRVYPTSTPSLTRVLLGCSNDDERAVEALIARLRIKEFILLIKDFEYIEEFSKHNIAILYEVIAQHYGLKTFYLDITSNFEVALFFACCRYDEKNRQWEPLSKKQIYEYEYGVLFQSHSHLNYL